LTEGQAESVFLEGKPTPAGSLGEADGGLVVTVAEKQYRLAQHIYWVEIRHVPRQTHKELSTYTSFVDTNWAKIDSPFPVMGLLEFCELVFCTAELYRVLGVGRDGPTYPCKCTQDQKEDATHCFQILGRVYAILSDREQRAVYNQQGTVNKDSGGLNQDWDWDAYWRLLTHKGSEEELADTKQAYLDFKGDMDQVMESGLCVQYRDEPRLRNIIQQAIAANVVPSHNAVLNESKQKMNARKRRAQEEAKEAELTRKELGLQDGVDDLKALIQCRQKDWQKEMDNFLAQMEAKD
ncbi:hypothetical protein U0070_015990, partial [Myodes glareolus]